MRRRLALAPAPLVALLAAVAIVGVAWSLFTPPFQVPDEDAHLAYVESLAEDQRRPAADVERYSPEQRAAERIARGRWIVERPAFRPVWIGAAEHRLAARRAELGERAPDQRIGSTQANDPPLYYAYQAVPYKLRGGSTLDRLFAMRLWSALLLLLTTTAAWLLAGEVFGRDRLLQLVTAACVGLQPMVTFMSGAVNQDAASYATAGLVLWLAVRILRRGPSARGVAALAAAVLAAALTKVILLTLAPAAALAVLAAYRRGGARPPLWALGAAGAALAAGAAVAERPVSDRLAAAGDLPGFASYLWQYYLPRLPFQHPVEGLGSFKAWIWVTGSWGRFGWLEVRFPYPVYALLALVTLAAFAGAALAARRRRVRVDRAVVAVFALAAASLLLGLHLADYDNLVDEGAPVNQGRYLLPLLPLGGLAAAAALTNLGARRRLQGAALVLGGMIALQLFSLALVAGRFYV